MKKNLLTMIAALALAFALSACSSGANTAGQATGSDESAASETSAEAGAAEAKQSVEPFVSDKLPAEGLIEEVPELKFSVDATSVSEDDKILYVQYENMPKEEFEAYVASLEEAGFTYNVSKTTEDDQLIYSASNGESFISIVAMANWYSNGSTSISFSDYRA